MDINIVSGSKLKYENGFKGEDMQTHCVPLTILPFEEDISILRYFDLLMNPILG